MPGAGKSEGEVLFLKPFGSDLVFSRIFVTNLDPALSSLAIILVERLLSGTIASTKLFHSDCLIAGEPKGEADLYYLYHSNVIWRHENYGCRLGTAKRSLSWYFICIRRLGCRDMSVDRGGHVLYFSDTLTLYLCQTSTDATDSEPGSSFDGPASPKYTSSLGRACRACWLE
nr:hypothetical protein [Tanacetum cinerariifolium]